MPKPILSDSLFNAEDVATAILNKANLQIANNSLAVTDITNKFDRGSTDISPDNNNNVAYHFMGFVFLDLYCSFSLTGNVTIFTINDSAYFPNVIYRSNSISYQQDSVNALLVKPDGNIIADSVHVPSGSDSTHRINLNMWYRTN